MRQQATRLLWGSEKPTGREKAVGLPVAVDSSKFKMAVREHAGGQLAAHREVGWGGGWILLIQSTENGSTNLELTKYGLSDIFIKV